MQIGNQCPTFTPSSSFFKGLNGENYLNTKCLIRIEPCPFCKKLFELNWDYKIASCKYAYHSWCVLSHFSTNTKCLKESCRQEMHLEWWALSTIKNPCTIEDIILGLD